MPVEERLSVLEAHWETLSPDLATRSDVRADVRGAENRMTLWIFGAALALAGFCFAILSASEGRMDKRMDALDTRMDKFDARLDRLDARIDKLDARIDKLDEKIDSRFDALTARFDALMAELRAQRRSAE